MTVPCPLQFGQVCSTAKKPCCIRTEPRPPQVLQPTGEEPGLRAAAVAGAALHRQRQADGDGVAEGRLLELELELVAQVGAAEHPRAPAAPADAEDVAEHLAEDVAEGVAAPEAAGAARARAADAGMAELVIGGALARILEDFPGFLDLLERRLGSGSPGFRSG
jgi:hypothetical protein